MSILGVEPFLELSGGGFLLICLVNYHVCCGIRPYNTTTCTCTWNRELQALQDDGPDFAGELRSFRALMYHCTL